MTKRGREWNAETRPEKKNKVSFVHCSYASDHKMKAHIMHTNKICLHIK